MKSFLIIGLNSFGHHLCRELYEQGSEVMIADIKESRLEDALKYSISAKVGDSSTRMCSVPSVLPTLIPASSA